MTMRVIGLDLTTSPEKATAFAVLSESKIALRGLPNPRFGPGSDACPERSRRDPGRAKLDLLILAIEMDIIAQGFVTDDEEIIALAAEQRPALVAIDAPLGLPLGLCCLEERCPCRPVSSRQGRQCERELSALGIGCYYTTKRSIIKGMVYRAIALKGKLEGWGFAVIEVYPYASRVRLFGKLPRKTTVAGRRALQERLRRLIPTILPPQESLLPHDALDALLAAYTGVLYVKGQTEALGDPMEGLLHIPIRGCRMD